MQQVIITKFTWSFNNSYMQGENIHKPELSCKKQLQAGLWTQELIVLHQKLTHATRVWHWNSRNCKSFGRFLLPRRDIAWNRGFPLISDTLHMQASLTVYLNPWMILGICFRVYESISIELSYEGYQNSFSVNPSYNQTIRGEEDDV